MLEEIYYVVEEQRLEAYLNMNYEGSNVNYNEHTIIFISIPIYQVHTIDELISCLDTGASISCIGVYELERRNTLYSS